MGTDNPYGYAEVRGNVTGEVRGPEARAHIDALSQRYSGTETMLLLAGTGVLVIVIGTGTAWLVTAFRFPGRDVVTWALLLPLAIPVYIVAYSYMDMLHPAGPGANGLARFV